MLFFIPAIQPTALSKSRHLLHQGKTDIRKNIYHSIRNPIKRNVIYKTIPSACMGVQSTKSQILQAGIDAAVEDHIKSGLNICIGGGPSHGSTALVDAISSLYMVSGLIDVAFITTSKSVRALLSERQLPNDLLVNCKKGIDVYIAVVSSVDSSCNAILDSESIAAEKFAAQIARQVVLIILEEDLEKNRQGFTSVPVQVAPFLPDVATENLCSPKLVKFGVRGTSLRDNRSNIVDISLSTDTVPHILDYHLGERPEVVATGFLLASSKTIAVVATNDLQPFDMTSPLHTMKKLTVDQRQTELSGEKRQYALQIQALEWKVERKGADESLRREFTFTTFEHAATFVRYVHSISQQVEHFPEIIHRGGLVEITVRSENGLGITQLDGLLSREISLAFSNIMGP